MIRKIVSIVLIVILLLFIKSRITTLQDLKNTGNSVEKVQKQLEEEKNRQALLSEQLKFVKSNEYIEEQAREKLNLTKNGEALVIDTNTQQEKRAGMANSKEKQVWEKWVEKFF